MPSERAVPQPIYIFLDESGNFDFSANGTKYFIITALSCRRPFTWEPKLNDLRYDIWENHPQVELNHFHASEDEQLVRDKVFETVTPHLGEFRVDSVIVEKRKTNPSLQSVERLYPKMMGYLLKYVFWNHPPTTYSEIKVVTDQIPVNKKKRAVEKSVKTTLSAMVDGSVRYSLAHRDSKACFNLQVADYLSWAIYKKWEHDDPRSFRLVEQCIKSQFDIFSVGTTLYY